MGVLEAIAMILTIAAQIYAMIDAQGNSTAAHHIREMQDELGRVRARIVKRQSVNNADMAKISSSISSLNQYRLMLDPRVIPAIDSRISQLRERWDAINKENAELAQQEARANEISTRTPEVGVVEIVQNTSQKWVDDAKKLGDETVKWETPASTVI